MDAIFKKDNVYVVIKDKELRDDIDLENIDNMIVCRESRHKGLYGGRVQLDECHYKSSYGYNGKYSIKVDGIVLDKFDLSDFSDEFSLEQTAAFLNQMENLGIDSFLQNYKCQVQEQKSKLENMIEDMQRDLTVEYDEKTASKMNSLKKLVLRMNFFIFILLVNMNAGLDNHIYNDVYDTIVKLYF